MTDNLNNSFLEGPEEDSVVDDQDPALARDAFLDGLMADGAITDALPPSTKPDTRERFTCEHCGGTGVWAHGRANRYGNRKCNACNGRGFFLTSTKHRADQRQKKILAERKKLQDGLDEFKAAHPDMFQELKGIQDDFRILGYSQTKSDFINSLSNQLFKKGCLSEKQVEAWYRGKAKLDLIRSKREAEAREAQVTVDLTPIRTIFETAVSNGYKRPKYRAEGLEISRAPMTGRNPGALYIKNESDAYGGKVVEVTFHPSRDGKATDFTPSGSAGDALKIIAADPLGAAVRYGNRTGRCACCGRELTNDVSIQRGIGPICAARWGLGDMVSAVSKEEAKAAMEETKKGVGFK